MDDAAQPTRLKTLLVQRHLQRYESFRTEYDTTAEKLAPTPHSPAPSRAQYYRWLSGGLKGGLPYPDACRVLEAMFPPWTASELFAPPEPELAVDGSDLTRTGSDLLARVTNSFSSKQLHGAWVTGYQFSEPTRHHVDIAHIAAEGDRLIRVQNFPPEPRTEGHTVPFRNAIEAELVNRHLVGYWKNMSDARYFGVLHLAVLPGETMMEGYYTGLRDDIHVSIGPWIWVLLDPESLADSDLSHVTLKEPAELYALLASRTQYDAPLALKDVVEDD